MVEIKMTDDPILNLEGVIADIEHRAVNEVDVTTLRRVQGQIERLTPVVEAAQRMYDGKHRIKTKPMFDEYGVMKAIQKMSVCPKEGQDG